MGNNKYEYSVRFSSVFGRLDVGAANSSEAYKEIHDMIADRLADAFPELDIEFEVELEDVWEGGDPNEMYERELEKEMCDW